MAIYLIALFVILAVMLAPVGSVVASGWIANAHGCKVDEGSVHLCMIGGKDYGSLLYTLGVMGWLMLVTLPAGALALLVWIVILIAHRLGWRNRPHRQDRFHGIDILSVKSWQTRNLVSARESGRLGR